MTCPPFPTAQQIQHLIFQLDSKLSFTRVPLCRVLRTIGNPLSYLRAEALEM